MQYSSLPPVAAAFAPDADMICYSESLWASFAVHNAKRQPIRARKALQFAILVEFANCHHTFGSQKCLKTE